MLIRSRGLLIILCAIFYLFISPAVASEVFEIQGNSSIDARYFPEPGRHQAQHNQYISLAMEPEIYIENTNGDAINIRPFFRYDSIDSKRTHLDFREAYALFFGELENSQWELRVGIDRVFWGVTESRRLVDIINQSDLVENPDGNDKLGQPMAHLSWINSKGTFELFALPYFRERTFPGRQGRLRSAPLVDSQQAIFESAAKHQHLDLASRYSNNINDLDIGLTWFEGTSREPTFTLGIDPFGSVVLVPNYHQIRQFGIDAQFVIGAWLLKTESYWREGELNAVSLEEDYFATVGGFEYVLFNLGDTSLDMSLMFEFLFDSRGANANVSTEKDLFSAFQINFNDEQNTNLLVGLFQDLNNSTRNIVLEAGRRLGEDIYLETESTFFLDTHESDPQIALSDDSYFEIRLLYYY